MEALTAIGSQYWQVIFLGQFLADGKDVRIAHGVQNLLNRRTWITKTGGQCLTANLLAAFRRLGYGTHPVVIEETEALAQRIVEDSGITCSAMPHCVNAWAYTVSPGMIPPFSARRGRAISINCFLGEAYRSWPTRLPTCTA